jgi:hypothetical protein
MTYMRLMRVTAFSIGALFALLAIVEALWNPFEHTTDKFLSATGVVLIFLGLFQKKPGDHEAEGE